MNRQCLCVALLLSFFPLTGAQATIILSNLPGTGTYKTTGQLLSTTTWEAVGLTTGASPETFNSFAGRYVNPGVNPSTLEGGIYADSSGNPGTMLSAFNNVAVPAGTTSATLFTLNTASSFSMQPNTTYWFVVHDISVPFAWVQDNSANGTAPTASGGNTFVGYRNSINSGTAWTTPAATAVNYTVEIAATPTPEPGTFVLGALGATGLLLVARRKRRSLR